MKDRKYEERDIIALKKSIYHWRTDNLNQIHREMLKMSSTDCALCEIYMRQIPTTDQVPVCTYCPIKVKVGISYCRNTPFTYVNNLRFDWQRTDIRPKDFDNSVLREIYFLEDLLKEAQEQFKGKEKPMRFEIWPKETKIEESIVRLGLRKEESGNVVVIALDDCGNRISGGNLVVFSTDGTITLCNHISEKLEFKLTPERSIEIKPVP